jgi:glycosyltransferase involved in cell wall biosynthesis
MKILMTADTVGGVWTYAVELIRALGNSGVDVVLATMGAMPTPEQLVQIHDLHNVELHSSSFKLEWMNDPWQDVRWSGEWLRGIAERARPDVIHLNGYMHGDIPWPAPALIVGHSCVLSWWDAVKGETAPKSWDRYSHAVARGLHSVRLVVAPTKTMLVSLQQHYGSFANMRVVANGRDPLLFPPGRKEPFVFAAGRVWDEAKNIASLAEVAPRLSWPVYVAGESGHPGSGCSEPENVKLIGRVAPQALPYWYARAGIYALPARYEPFGLSALEAGLAGCALVLGDIPSLREVWGDAALYVPPNDTDALESAVSALIEDEALRVARGDRARARALEYTPQRMAEGYIKAYNDLLGTRLRTTELAGGQGAMVIRQQAL